MYQTCNLDLFREFSLERLQWLASLVLEFLLACALSVMCQGLENDKTGMQSVVLRVGIPFSYFYVLKTPSISGTTEAASSLEPGGDCHVALALTRLVACPAGFSSWWETWNCLAFFYIPAVALTTGHDNLNLPLSGGHCWVLGWSDQSGQLSLRQANQSNHRKNGWESSHSSLEQSKLSSSK